MIVYNMRNLKSVCFFIIAEIQPIVSTKQPIVFSLTKHWANLILIFKFWFVIVFNPVTCIVKIVLIACLNIV